MSLFPPFLSSLIDPKIALPRLQAAGIHLAVSATVALVLILLITEVWYPSRLFELAKGRDIFLLLICCDITLGPALTLVVFNIKKPRKELARDVAVIATVQMGAMIYGVSTLLQARPAYIVYNVGQFNIPLANELVSDVSSGPDHSTVVPSAPWTGPKLVGSELPADREENNNLIFSSVFGQGDVYQIPRYFVPYDKVRQEVIAHGLLPSEFAKRFHFAAADIESATLSYRQKQLDFRVLPLRVRTTIAIAVVDAKSGDLLGIEQIPSSF